MESVNLILDEIGAIEKPTIVVFNKTDKFIDKSEGVDQLILNMKIVVWIH